MRRERFSLRTAFRNVLGDGPQCGPYEAHAPPQNRMMTHSGMSPTTAQLFAQATAHHQAGRLADAEALYRQVLARDPNHAESIHLLAIIAHSSGNNIAAMELIMQAIRLAPRVADYHGNFGLFLAGDNRLDEAIGAYRYALSLKRDLPDVYNNLGNTLRLQGHVDEAMAHFRQAIALRPNYPEAMNNLANVLREQGKFDQSMPLLRAAIQLRPSYAEAHNSMGALLERLGKLDDAITAYRQALALRPQYPDAQWNLGLALLLQGKFEEGWPLYEARRVMATSSVARHFTQLLWDGSNLNGRRILLHTEQGLGDTIQFARYVAMVKARGGRVIVQCQPPLQRLLSGQLGIEKVVAAGQPLPDFDVQCPLMSLALIFRTTLQSIPASIPYLFTDRSLTDHWRRELVQFSGKRKIGLAWAGSSIHPHDRDRSFPLETFAPLATLSNVQFFSLQKGEPAIQARVGGGVLNLIDRTEEFHNFADTASFIANLDMVICADTSVAHLAGALGKPTGLLVPFAPDWRWMLNRPDTPWYPTMRLFRQPCRGDWKTPVRLILSELLQMP